MDRNGPFEKTSAKLSFKQLAVNNFLGGVFWALGVTIGISFLIAALGVISHYVNFVPFIGKFVSDVIDFVILHNPRLQ